MLPAHWTLPASISVLCDFYGQINQYLICDSLLTPANPMERSATEGGRQLLWLRPSRRLNRTSGRTCVDRLRTLISNGELPLSLQKEPESSHLHLHLHLYAQHDHTSPTSVFCFIGWCMIMLSVHQEVPLVQSSKFYWWHYLKFVWDASRARCLMRSRPTNTAEDCNWTHSSQELLSIWPPSRCNK